MTGAPAEKTCAPCRGGIPPLTRDEAQRLQAQARDWQLADGAHRIERTFRFRYFLCSGSRRARRDRRTDPSSGEISPDGCPLYHQTITLHA
jgi:hypothetical protein